MHLRRPGHPGQAGPGRSASYQGEGGGGHLLRTGDAARLIRNLALYRARAALVQLDERPKAKAFFAQLSGRNRYAILYRLQDAKRPVTRARRLAKFVAMLEAGETIHP